jgi:hypothetical protein
MMSWKGCGRTWLWPNFEVLPLKLLGGTEENYENLYKDIRSPVRDFNPRTPEYDELSNNSKKNCQKYVILADLRVISKRTQCDFRFSWREV